MKTRHAKKLDKIALEMISNSYFFKYDNDNPYFKSLQVLGNCRVVGVVINESSAPELLLLEHGAVDPNFYHMEQLQISLLLDATG